MSRPVGASQRLPSLGFSVGAVSFGACVLLGGEVDLAPHCLIPTGTVIGAGNADG
jgi:hypothetical protein